MRRVVVCTPSGELIAETDVDDKELVEAVSACMQLQPDAQIYIDGALVSDDVRKAVFLGIASETRAAPKLPLAPAPVDCAPAKVKEYGETMRQVFEDARRTYVQSLVDLRECTKQFSDMWMEREKQFADEMARQRGFTSKSLSDIDLLGRSVKATQFQQLVEAAGPRTMARGRRREGGMNTKDMAVAILRTLTGQK